MVTPVRVVLTTTLLIATTASAIASGEGRPMAPLVATADIKTAPEPSRPPDVVPERGARPTDSEPRADAQRAHSIDPRAPISGLSGIDRSRTHYDEPGDGSLWVRGANYKMSFDAAGATYFPLFGSRQVEHHPHAFSPDSVTIGGTPIDFERAPARARVADRVELDRGSFVEAYDFTPGAIEQTFVFASLPAAGELVVHIPLATPLERSECADGFEFRGELGRVSYGRATAIDATGRSMAAPTSIDAGGITIRVDADFISRATFPLVVDPIVNTFAVDTTSFDDYLADVSYDATYDRWLVVYEETVTSNDHDIYHVVLNGNGGYLWGGYLNSNNASWSDPRCANANSADQFLVAARVAIGDVDANIRGRTVNAAFAAPGGEFAISSIEDGRHEGPSVGGDPFPFGPALYCVSFTRIYGPGDNDIIVRMVGTDTSVSAPIYLANSGNTLEESANVSRSNGGDTWVVTWSRYTGYKTSDIWCGRIRYDGVVQNGPTQITAGGYSNFPCVSSPLQNTQRTLIVHQFDYGPDDDIHAILLDGTTVIQSVNLTLVEGVQVFRDQRFPYVDSDGQHFLVAYAEQASAGSSNYDLYASDLFVTGNTLGLKQSHENLASTVSLEDRVRLASTQGSGGANRRFMAVWERRNSATDHDILGALFDTYEGGLHTPVCFGDGTSGTCPCSNNGLVGRGCASSVNAAGAQLFAGGNFSTVNDTTALDVTGVPSTATCLFFQGANIVNAVPFGDGLSCLSGEGVRIGTKTAVGGHATYPGPGDSSIRARGFILVAGGRRGYQVWYRDSAPFCTSARFNATNGIQIDWAR